MTNSIYNTVTVSIFETPADELARGAVRSDISATRTSERALNKFYKALDALEAETAPLPEDAFDSQTAFSDALNDIVGETVEMIIYKDGTYDICYGPYVTEQQALWAMLFAFEVL